MTIALYETFLSHKNRSFSVNFFNVNFLISTHISLNIDINKKKYIHEHGIPQKCVINVFLTHKKLFFVGFELDLPKKNLVIIKEIKV